MIYQQHNNVRTWQMDLTLNQQVEKQILFQLDKMKTETIYIYYNT